jgi:hypothetical protein
VRCCSILLGFACCCTSLSAHEVDVPITTGSELLEWCRTESERQFVAAGKPAYNWTARHQERGNLLQVEGRWRVEGVRHAVVCRVARGALPEHATVSVTAEP